MLAGGVVQGWGAHDDPQHPNRTEVKNVHVDDSEMHMKGRDAMLPHRARTSTWKAVCFPQMDL